MPKTLFGRGGPIITHGDISEPIDVVWEAERGLLDGK